MKPNMTRIKSITRHLAEALGTDAKITLHQDESERSSISMYIATVAPYVNTQTVSTLGLSEYRNGDYDFGVEIIGVCYSNFTAFADVIAAAAFRIMSDVHYVFPGSVFTHIVDVYDDKTKLPHLLFTHPIFWEDQFPNQVFENRRAVWLQAIPISEAETQFLEKHGLDALESLFEAQQIDIFDIHRKSVVSEEGLYH